MTNTREKLVELLRYVGDNIMDFRTENFMESLASFLIAHGVAVQESCHKAESVISRTGLMCTACHSDIDRDAVFCKYCGAKVIPQPPKGE